MNPCHKGHLSMMELAKENVEAEGWTVIGGILSPSHDKYVQPKCHALKTQFENGEIRCTLANKIIEDLDPKLNQWLSIGTWETHPGHEYWPDYPIVFTELK